MTTSNQLTNFEAKPTAFQFGNFPLNVVTDEAGVYWFNANEVCSALEYANSRKAVADHVDGDDVTKRDTIDSLGRTQQSNHVNESGLYALVFGSNLDSAKKFKRWVTSEVLPSIRKTGTLKASTVEQLGDSKYAKLGADLMRAVRYQEYDSAKELDAMLDKLDFEPAARAEGVPVSVIRNRIAMHTTATVRLDHIARGEHGHSDSVRDVVSLAQAKAQTEDMEAKIESRRLLEIAKLEAYRLEMSKSPLTLAQIDANDRAHKHDFPQPAPVPRKRAARKR